jgi:hypothetical protein
MGRFLVIIASLQHVWTLERTYERASLREPYFAGSGTLTSTAATICHLPLRRIQVSVHT